MVSSCRSFPGVSCTYGSVWLKINALIWKGGEANMWPSKGHKSEPFTSKENLTSNKHGNPLNNCSVVVSNTWFLVQFSLCAFEKERAWIANSFFLFFFCGSYESGWFLIFGNWPIVVKLFSPYCQQFGTSLAN